MAVKRAKNIVNANMESYAFLVMGLEKSGKTTFFFETMARKYGRADAGLLLPFEVGYKALSQLEYITVEDEQGIEKPFINEWDDLIEIVDTLVENRFTDYKDVRALGIDTIDRLYALAEDEVMRQHKKKFGVSASSINEVFKGFGRGKAMMKELVYDIMQKLRLAGYGIWFLGHTKFKNVKKDGDTEGYDTLASNLNEDLYKNIAQDMDFIIQIKMERIKGTDNTLEKINRKLIFTSDGYHTCGSRFGAFLPSEIDLDALTFLNVFDEAIMKAGNWTKEELLLTREQQLAKRDELAKTYVIEEKGKKEIDVNVKVFQKIFDQLPMEAKTVVSQKMVEIKAVSIDDIPNKMSKTDFDNLLVTVKGWADNMNIKY